jgi:hypothetical protein
MRVLGTLIGRRPPLFQTILENDRCGTTAQSE